jgi:pimeloyl-ACP methyl ester carboxylesterase
MALMSFIPTFAEEGYKTTYVQMGRQSAVLYQPATASVKSQIGVVVMHSNDNYMGFIANAELSKRGYTVIATIPSGGDDMAPKLINIKNCVNYLRQTQGIKKVILLGHSGGATVMTAYQLIAEQGVQVLKNKIYNDYSDNLSDLPKVDGMLLLDANYGNSVMRLISLDPNIKGAGTGMGVAKKLSLTDTKVGYNPDGSSSYTEAFKHEYEMAQVNRLNEIMAEAQNRLAAIKAGKGNYSDDEPFTVAGANQIRMFNKLFPQDLSLLNHTKKAWTLIHGDGSTTTEIVHSLRAPMQPDTKVEGLSQAMTTTVRGFLSSTALKVNSDFRITDTGFEGIDWTSNINNPVGNAEGITVPILMVGMTGSWEYLAAEHIYNHCPSADKSIAFVEGASHMFFPDPDAERYNNKKFGNTVKALFDYVDSWLSNNGRFL